MFGGIGACSKALERLNIDFEIVDYVEIDKYAVKSFNAIHNTNFEPQDITKWNKKIEVDLIMHGSPCQDFSVAGKNKGGDLGSNTRSSLMYETIRIVENLKPKYVIWENVKNLLSKKHKHNFDNYIKILNDLGYNSYYQVLNAKDYGIPQNRERVFTISISKDIDEGSFLFPEKQELRIRLKDILETEVDKKYYLSEKMQDYVLDFNNKQKGTAWEGRADEEKLNTDIAHAIGVRSAGGNQRAGVSNFVIDGYDEEIKVKDLKVKIKNATKKGYIEATDGDSINLAYPNSKTRRGRVGNQISQTLTANDNMAVLEAPYIVASRGRNPDNPSSRIAGEHLEQRLEANTNGTTNCISTVQKDNYVVEENIKIIKLTPKECWRISGINKINIPQVVKVRKYPVDTEKLKEVLRNAKIKTDLTNTRIAFELDVPLTTVEHWFRKDNSFSIPDEEIWWKLKNLLCIETTEFDESITTFEEKEGIYEKANRCYCDNGISPTITSTSANEKIITGVAEIGDSIDFQFKKQRRNRIKKGIAGTLLTTVTQGVFVN